MVKLNLVAFYVKAIFLALSSWIVKFFNEEKAKKLRGRIGESAAKLGVKAIRNKWCDLLKDHMKLFCKHSIFQRELILANHICDDLLFDMLDSMNVEALTKDNIRLLFATKTFHETDFKKKILVNLRLKWFQSFDYTDVNSADKDLTKFFYKQCNVGENDIGVAKYLVPMFEDNEQFIVWQAMHKAKGDIVSKFLDIVIRDNNIDLLKRYVKQCGIKDCYINISTGMPKIFLECRSEMTLKPDILLFEKYLLKYITLYGEEQTANIVKSYGLQLESLPYLLDLLDSGYSSLLKSYKEWTKKDPKSWMQSC
ncbi:MAG: hypothetical protein E7020_06160 [Alphaproteobacteria bacterium]|nr:hypothetical protein [Alphaproteobacteria bacterium]